MALDGTLYVVTDRELARGRTHAEIAEDSLAGGARVIQLRDKDATDAQLEKWGTEMLGLCEEYDATFVVNDRLDVAKNLNAHALHLGQSDMPIAEARQLWDGLLGASASTLEQAVNARRDGADYVGLGPIWATPTKTDADTPCGLECITITRKIVDIPIVAIGGIGLQNVADVIRAGAHSAAVVSAVVAAENVESASRRMVELIEVAHSGI
jgi:thiamine-phosphate pyrophosphorylase